MSLYYYSDSSNHLENSSNFVCTQVIFVLFGNLCAACTTIIILFHYKSYAMGIASKIVQTHRTAKITNVPADIIREMGLDAGDTLVWTCDKTTKRIIIDIYKSQNGE